MTIPDADRKYWVLTGNYGSGKTETSINLALGFAAAGQATTLVDLDIVNPYFRSGEKAPELEGAGIRVLMPTFAMTTVDIPALPAEIQSVFELPGDRVIFDVGGDDTGAAALGRYYPSFMAHRSETKVCLVINCMRPLTESTEDIVELALRIQARGRLRFDLIINNTNLAGRTTPEMLEAGEETALQVAERLQIEKVLSTGEERLLRACHLRGESFPIRRYMKPEWLEEDA